MTNWGPGGWNGSPRPGTCAVPPPCRPRAKHGRMAQTLRWYTPQHLARIIVSLARTCAWTQLPARWVPACHTPVVPYWGFDLHTRVPACHEPDRRDKRATHTDYVCILTFLIWLCSLQFTAVLGGNKAHMNIVSKLPKIIRICWYVVIMPHVYSQNGF